MARDAVRTHFDEDDPERPLAIRLQPGLEDRFRA